jgi:hypothetical protein
MRHRHSLLKEVKRMGLDNGFVIRSRKNPDLAIEIAYFRKYYYELDDWCLHHCKHIEKFEVEITKNVLDKLRSTIEPIAEALLKLGITKVGYYDENGYPKKFNVDFYGNDFNPADSNSFIAGVKLCRLYCAIDNMYDVLESNGDDIYIMFYSSF